MGKQRKREDARNPYKNKELVRGGERDQAGQCDLLDDLMSSERVNEQLWFVERRSMINVGVRIEEAR